jgi:hypothetical protein
VRRESCTALLASVSKIEFNNGINDVGITRGDEAAGVGAVEVSPKGVPVPRNPMEISSVGPEGPLLRGGGATLEGTVKDVPRRLFRPDAGAVDPNPIEDPTAKYYR